MIYIGRVLSNKDDDDCGRIKVYIEDIDRERPEGDYAVPIIPRIIQAIPREGEMVNILVMDDRDGRNFKQRFYIGPIISQMQNLPLSYFDEALSSYNFSAKNKKTPLKYRPIANGCFAKTEEIAINGRKNCDIIVGDDSIRIRSGAKMYDGFTNGVYKFNTINPSFIQLTYKNEPLLPLRPVYNADGVKVGTEVTDVYSTAVMSAEEIILAGTRKYHSELTEGRSDMITDENLKKLIAECHPLPYGDVLAKILHVFRVAFLNHVHNWGPVKPCPKTEGYDELTTLDLSSMLSQDVKIS